MNKLIQLGVAGFAWLLFIAAAFALFFRRDSFWIIAAVFAVLWWPWVVCSFTVRRRLLCQAERRRMDIINRDPGNRFASMLEATARMAFYLFVLPFLLFGLMLIVGGLAGFESRP